LSTNRWSSDPGRKPGDYRSLRVAFVALSTLAILIATLHNAGGELPTGWSLTISDGDDALAGLIQNLLLFIPLGASLVLAGVHPLVAVAIGSALSCSVEFAQQWIPGRDPSLGDIICNANSTAIGVALVVFAPRWLWPPPRSRRAAWQALATACLAVLVWLGTGAVLRPIFPDPPYQNLWTPDWYFWGHYRGKVLSSQGTISARDRTFALRATVVAPSRPPGRDSPLVVIADSGGTNLLILGADGSDLLLLYHTRALPLTLEHPDLRWRGALARVAPNDTFTAQTWRDEHGVCLGVNSAQRCGYGYTIGDGWKLIFYPEHYPVWLFETINMLWITGWTIGIGYWAGRAGKSPVRVAAVALIIGGLLLVPVLTQLKVTPVHEWLGAVLGLGVGYLWSQELSRDRELSDTPAHLESRYRAPP